MCSRYSLTTSPQALSRVFGRYEGEDFPPRYNIAPSQPVLIVRTGFKGEREFRLVRWGLIPSWAKDPGQYGMLVNARSETAAEKPSFRGPMRHRRCLVPTTGYYEWTGGRGSKQPHLIRLKDQPVFAMAGLWEAWLGADGSEIETMAILTTAASDDVAAIHDRMPAIIPQEAWSLWLDPNTTDAAAVQPLLRPYPADAMKAYPVTTRVGSPRVDDPSLIEPLEHPEGQLKLF